MVPYINKCGQKLQSTLPYPSSHGMRDQRNVGMKRGESDPIKKIP